MGKSKKSAESKTSVTVGANTEDETAVAVDEKAANDVELGDSEAIEQDTPAVEADATPGAAVETQKEPPPARKTLGTKEVIPFEWKVIGRSGEMILTLFKSVERADADAHYARLDNDGAYKDLQVVAINHKIVQSKSVKEQFVAKAFRDKEDVGGRGGSAKKSAGRVRAKKTPKKETRITSKKTLKKTAAKSTRPTSKKAVKKAAKKTAKRSETTAKKKASTKKAATKKTVKKKTVVKSTAKKKTAKKKTTKKKK